MATEALVRRLVWRKRATSSRAIARGARIAHASALNIPNALIMPPRTIRKRFHSMPRPAADQTTYDAQYISAETRGGDAGEMDGDEGETQVRHTRMTAAIIALG
jgi:hypothetical protein